MNTAPRPPGRGFSAHNFLRIKTSRAQACPYYVKSLAFLPQFPYNMFMKLIKLTQEDRVPDFPASSETFGAPGKVQGGILRTCGNTVYVESGGRFKRFAEGPEYVKIVAGSGHFKWARGETPFAAGESFVAENAGEYELNGACTFIVARK